MPLNIARKFMEGMNRAVVSDRLLEDSLTVARRRKPILVGMLAISGCAALMLTVALTGVYAISGNTLHLLAMLIALITLVGYAGTLWHFRQNQQWMIAANLYGATTTFSTVAPCMITGGMLSSPYLPLALIVPTFLFLIAGRRHGMFWSLVVASCAATLFLLESFGVTFPQAIPEESMITFRFATWLTTLMLLIIGLASYEMNFELLTQRIFAERSQFAHEAMHDPLTGLSNRKLFYVRAQEAVHYALEHDHKAALIFIDLNDFKLVNDNLGHEVGDDVLNTIANRLRDSVRSIDTVARLGGDEFAIVLHGIAQVEAADLMMEKLATVLSKPLAAGNNILSTSGSFGIAIAPDQGTEVEQLLHVADQAMYRAKDLRKNPRAEDLPTACRRA